MAYPKIDLPMYQPLKDSAIERFLPNINLIAQNSITLMETNQRFIEAYMVGLNYEFARKLLWREYPTDQRGSYFRQFWYVGDTIDSEGLSADALKEKLYDIPEIHRWPLTSALGDHNNRGRSRPDRAPQAVLIIRGELLKKYPNTVIFAQHAKIVDGLRTPDWLTPAEEAQPPRSKTRTPLYEAQPADDIYFFGFDLTIDRGEGHRMAIRAGTSSCRSGRASRASASRSRRDAPLEVFDELTWDDAMPGGQPGQFLPASALPSVALTEPSDVTDPDEHDQWSDDEQVDRPAASSARWAYVLVPPAGDGRRARRRNARREQALTVPDFASAQARLACRPAQLQRRRASSRAPARDRRNPAAAQAARAQRRCRRPGASDEPGGRVIR